MLPHQFKDNVPCQLRSSYGMSTMPLFPRQHNSSKRKGGTERVTGRKARGLQMEEIGCKCQTFLSLLSGRRKQTGSPKGGNRLQVSDIFLSLKQQEETS